MNSNPLAESDFSRAVRKAFWRKVSSWLTGEKNELLPFDEVRERLPLKGQSYLGLQTVDIDKIVGSLGRYRDFDRAFLPRQTKTRSRWISIDSAHYAEIPLPPVELYKIGEVYFVKDGNHRVSVARERGQEMIDAYVIEIIVPVEITADLDLKDLLLKEEYARFLEQTRIKKYIPDAQIELTLPGEYERILEHISTHRWFLGEEQQREVSFEGALVSWFYNVYMPLVLIIRTFDLVNEFPHRTEADLYLWIVEYQWYRKEAYREHFSIEGAARDFAESSKDWPIKKLVHLLRDAAWVDNLILLHEQEGFLERTRLLHNRPEAQIELTQPGQFEKILEHISVHQWYIGEERGADVAYDEAASSWFDHVYSPLIEHIRDHHILEEFPGRTETDLYLWIMDHRAHLNELLGWEIDAAKAADDLLGQTADPEETTSGLLVADSIEALPPSWDKDKPGSKTESRLDRLPGDQLFSEILVPLSGEESDWRAMDQAIIITGYEPGRIHGLHVVPTGEEANGDPGLELRNIFLEKTRFSQIPGDFVVTHGNIVRQIIQRSRWVDLIVLPLNYPPASGPISRLGSGIRLLIRHSSRPLLAIPAEPSELVRPLLAYDGSRMADEALFIAASMARRRQIDLTVITVEEKAVTNRWVARARAYLEHHGVTASYIEKVGRPGKQILEFLEENANDLILMGGYGHHPVLELVLGNTVDEVLNHAQVPVLICK